MTLISRSLSQMALTVLLFLLVTGAVEILIYVFARKVLGRKSAAVPMFLAPALLGLVLLILYPLIYSVILSFSNMNLHHFRNPDFSLALGWRNLSRLFTEPVLREVRIYALFFRTALWSFIQICLQTVLAYLLALSLEKPIRFKWFFRGILILPWAIPGVLAINVWVLDFNYTFGAVNLLLKALRGEQAMIHWMSSPFWNYTAMTIVNQWLGFPFLMVIISSAMKSVPPEMYEASELEGAGAVTRVFRIQIPLLAPLIAPAVLLIFTGNFMGFEIPYFLNQHNLETSDFLATALFRMAFVYNQYGYSAAFSWVLTALLSLISIVFIKKTKGFKGVTE
ncbi:carbohydrate ABC transporter permease [Spirochaeta isovalerica]|uniref:Arabinogalactan oligomer/maltooligosaccharide transport system permease protein n=1 Tax=Spirochaeta isovalerica TaxID=150 RepID=A0A841RCA2_9SPIO|nr:sugar ABC transporter permease [Spirochaeta isovalerica]MBB6480509.1 arabinogalactan oligomer/maltooligosaccharide transport system permease protein [Spirochaeta isovalerica]